MHVTPHGLIHMASCGGIRMVEREDRCGEPQATAGTFSRDKLLQLKHPTLLEIPLPLFQRGYLANLRRKINRPNDRQVNAHGVFESQPKPIHQGISRPW